MLHHDFDKSAEIMEALIMRSSEAGELSMKVSRLQLYTLYMCK